MIMTPIVERKPTLARSPPWVQARLFGNPDSTLVATLGGNLVRPNPQHVFFTLGANHGANHGADHGADQGANYGTSASDQGNTLVGNLGIDEDA